VTSTMPYVFLTILVVRGMTLDGAMDGVQFYLFGEVDETGVHRLNLDKLFTVEIWQKAATQIFAGRGLRLPHRLRLLQPEG
jgi:SNF family Na+-dependent transporter